MATEVEQIQKIDWAAIMVLIIGTFMAILDNSIVNVAIPKMMAVFGASQDSIEWVLTGYMLTLGVVMPLSGYMGDRFGYKRVFMTSLTLFIIGSALCGMSWSVNSMIAARVIQALGGGMMQPLTFALMYRYCPRSKIGMVMGVWGISAMVAPAIGPALGGYLVDYASWRMIFYINVPIGIINILLATANLKETELIKVKSVDTWGVVLSSVGFFSLLMAINKAATKGWTSPFIIGLLLTAFISLLIFAFVELNHSEPILELRLFKNYLFTLSNVIVAILSMGLFGAIFLIPIYIQNILGFSAMTSGLITLPSALASGIMMPIAGRIFDKHGARMVAITGLAIVTVTTYLMHNFDLMTPFVFMITCFTLRGVGMGLCNMPVATAGMNTVPMHLVGKASAMTNVIRQVSASFGVAMFTTILQNREAFHYAVLAQSVNLNANQAQGLQSGLAAIATAHGLSSASVQSIALAAIVQKISLMSAANGIDDCFIVAAAFSVVALVLCPLIKDKKAAAPVAQAGTRPVVAD